MITNYYDDMICNSNLSNLSAAPFLFPICIFTSPSFVLSHALAGQLNTAIHVRIEFANPFNAHYTPASFSFLARRC